MSLISKKQTPLLETSGLRGLDEYDKKLITAKTFLRSLPEGRERKEFIERCNKVIDERNKLVDPRGSGRVRLMDSIPY